jgi:aryl-alcohol dehydrogenase-like predicted oxidoreductase
MEYRRFGRTGLQVSVMGLGTGGPSQLGQGSGVPEAEARRAVRRALELGVNLVDTAADYRESEAILGRALADVPRDSYVLCTKFTPVRSRAGEAADASPLKPEQELLDSLDRSLRRLNTDHVDLFQLHGVTPEWYARARDRFLPALRRLQEGGKVRFLGITESFAADPARETLRQALADDLFDTLMVGYNLLTPGPEDWVLPEAGRRDVGVLVMCAVRRKIGRPADLAALIADLKARGELAPDALPNQGPLDWLIHDGVDSVTSAAYRFAAGGPAVSSVLTGTANAAHLEQNVRAILGGPLPAEDRRRLLALFGPVGRKLGN